MTKPVTRKLAVDCLLHRVIGWYGQLPCGLCRAPLLPGQEIQFDHIHADVHEGPHEYTNLRPVHAECHKRKTKADVQAKAKGDRLLGLTCNGPKAKIRSRGFDKTRTRKFSGEVVRRA